MAALDVEAHEFLLPKKEVAVAADIQKWEKSEAYRDLVGFLGAMNEAVRGKKIKEECVMSQLSQNLIELLNTLEKWVAEIPPIDQPQRFGNKAFRDWFKRLQDNSEDLLKKAMPEKFHKAVPEIAVYFVESVGNSTRIDYGTGHEMAFATFLLCLFKIGAFTQEDSQAVVLRVFNRYLEVMRKLQQTYRMEPAGSMGVWNLDDYQFIPFIWGSSQLIGHKRITPKSFPDRDICDGFAHDYMFLSCIQYIHQVKTGPFAEHSNQLWNVSGVPLWEKVNKGLVKMYKAEVLNKFPVIQHFLFGSLLRIDPAQ